MKKNILKRLCLYLSVLMVLPTILGMFPASVSAASESNVTWIHTVPDNNGKLVTPVVQVEAGQKFYAGDLLLDLNLYFNGAVSTATASYKSSKPSVASINKKSGLVTTKKTGKTTISITYKKKTYKSTFQVVAKGKLGTTTNHKKINDAAKKMYSTSPSNASKMISALKKYVSLQSSTINYYGIEWGSTKTVKLVIPFAGRANAICRKYDPLSIYSGTFINPTKGTASASKNEATLTLKKALTKNQLLYANYFKYMPAPSSLSKVYKSTSNTVWFCKRADIGKSSYTAVCRMQKGSNKIKVRLYKDNWNGTYSRVKIKKGQKIIFTPDSWKKKISVSVGK